jgi:hypothetical protein
MWFGQECGYHPSQQSICDVVTKCWFSWRWNFHIWNVNLYKNEMILFKTKKSKIDKIALKDSFVIIL